MFSTIYGRYTFFILFVPSRSRSNTGGSRTSFTMLGPSTTVRATATAHAHSTADAEATVNTVVLDPQDIAAAAAAASSSSPSNGAARGNMV